MIIKHSEYLTLDKGDYTDILINLYTDDLINTLN